MKGLGKSCTACKKKKTSQFVPSKNLALFSVRILVQQSSLASEHTM